MTNACLGCSCTAPRTTPRTGRLVLATQVDHTATALRSLALDRGQHLRALAPGLLSLDVGAPDEFVTEARAVLSVVESDEVRCLVLATTELPDVALLSQALTAPTLTESGARVQHADLLPLFADEQRHFSAAYQPIVELGGRSVIGHEALLRTSTEDGTAVAPEVLFRAAETAGWIHLLDRIGRTTALRHAGPWLGPDALLFINFIPTSIYRPEVCLRTTEQAAREAGVRLDQLVFEVTEGHRVHDLTHLERVFDHYRSHRCRVALDDVGAGWSSLNMLVRLKPDIVKLDKEIVQSLPDPTGAAVVRAIVDIAHQYGGQVLAECVETEEQARVAADLGVDLAQGWLFGHPVSPATTPAPRPRTRSSATSSATSSSATSSSATSSSATGPVDPSRPDSAVAIAVRPELTGASSGQAGMSALLVRAVHGSLSAVVVVDVRAPDSPLLYVNPAFEAITGYSSAEVVGRNCRLLQGPDTDPAALRALARALARGEEHTAVLRNRRRDGTGWWNELHLSPVVDERGELTHYLGYQNDVTARVEAEALLARQATEDSLTGLANRTHLLDHLAGALAHAEEGDRCVGVLFVDLDGFKAVNDRHGHAAGDRVLVQVAGRLRAALRASDLVSRTGGDEFVAVLADLDPLDAHRVVERLAVDVASCLRRPFVVGDTTAALSGSVGTALAPRDAGSAEQLLARADAAMYRAKRPVAG